MDKALLQEKKKQANSLKPMFQLGKAGITASFIALVDNYLKVHEIVKIKVLIATNTGDITFYADEISKETKSTLIEKKGYTFTVYRLITKQNKKDKFWANQDRLEEKEQNKYNFED
jgi:RNA-binding protein